MDKKYYNLYSRAKYNYSDSILITAFEKDPTMQFAEGDKIILYLKDYKTGGYKIIVFGLWGFSKALVNYNAKCLSK